MALEDIKAILGEPSAIRFPLRAASCLLLGERHAGAPVTSIVGLHTIDAIASFHSERNVVLLNLGGVHV